MYEYEYPMPMLTTDAVVLSHEQATTDEGADVFKVMLIKRGGEPFKGQWALPGGFVNENEDPEDACRRELREETGVEVGDIYQIGAFGKSGRDPRGWSVSVAFVAQVKIEDVEPKAADDAADVGWFDLEDLPEMAFDHADIVGKARVAMANGLLNELFEALDEPPESEDDER